MRRYGVIIVPTIASTIAAVDIINNAKHRNLLEKCCPLFGRSMNAFFFIYFDMQSSIALHVYPVDLVRRYHGFADEDSDEIRRIRCVEKQLRSRKINASSTPSVQWFSRRRKLTASLTLLCSGDSGVLFATARQSQDLHRCGRQSERCLACGFGDRGQWSAGSRSRGRFEGAALS